MATKKQWYSDEFEKLISPANWNRSIDDFTEMFWDVNTSQYWLDTEFPISKDAGDWSRLSDDEREVYKAVFGGLTMLDTLQGAEGMPFIMQSLPSSQSSRKAVLSFMGTMEFIHSKSYSTIFTTLLDNSNEIDGVFDWVEGEKHLQYKGQKIAKYYRSIDNNESLYMAMVASVFLESLLFYSGFFYPLYKKGLGKMNNTGEVISMIVRDEQVHGVFVGLLARELREQFDAETVERLNKETYELLEVLMENEIEYTRSVYSSIGLDNEVIDFVYYNANKALQNLDLESPYKDREINPIVENGIKIKTKSTDFFSVKGDSYFKATVEEVSDDDFDFGDRL